MVSLFYEDLTTNLEVADQDNLRYYMKDSYYQTKAGKRMLAQLKASKNVLIPTIDMLDDDYISGINKQLNPEIVDEDHAENNVKLLQRARADFRAELNKYNTSIQRDDQGNLLVQSDKERRDRMKSKKDFLHNETGNVYHEDAGNV